MNKRRQRPAQPDADDARRRFLARSSVVPVGMLAMPLAGCGDGMAQPRSNEPVADGARANGSPPYTVDRSIVSPNRDARARTLVLHYTALSLADSLARLTDSRYEVSAHYLVPDEPDGGKDWRVYALVPEAERAWHAGISYWQGERLLNAGSIGIEIVNLGFPAADENLPLMARRWYPFGKEQIAVVGALAAAVVARHQIKPHKVVGHFDIAPGRKTDPGPLFPWQRLHEEFQLGAWPDREAVEYYRSRQPYDGNLAALQGKLLAYGYDTPLSGALDRSTVDVISAFQMHFRPARYDGVPDTETVAMLDALLEKYFGWVRGQASQTRQMRAAGHGEKGPDSWPPGAREWSGAAPF